MKMDASKIRAPTILTNSMKESLRKFVSPSSPFDKFILGAIVINSIAIACVDYQHVDSNYQPSTDSSFRNNVIDKAEYIFTIIFTLECLLKCAACGVYKGKQAYLRDGWNVLDFCIVVVSILGLLPNAPNFTMLRSFRVLRPLRSISKLPNLRKIIGGFIGSLPELANVMVLLLFILVCFALFGVTFWSGLFHSRCRLTPFPIRMPVDCRSASDPCWNEFMLDAISNPEVHRCLPVPNDDPQWLTNDPQDCIWPIDEIDTRVCSLNANYGDHHCIKDVEFMSINVTRYCGSNYNVDGSPRFISSSEPFGYDRSQSDVFNSDLNWGFTSFDNFWSSFLTSFQILTMEGWSDILYRTMDSWSTAPTIIAYVTLIVLGSQLAINIMLAVITDSLDDAESSRSEALEDLQEERGSFPMKQAKRPFITHVQWLIRTNLYEKFILSIIILNTVALSCDHYGISEQFLSILDGVNFFTTVVFCIDMVLGNIVIGVLKYWSTPSKFFDGVIAISSAVELIVTSVAASGSSGKSVSSVFRSLRLVRLFKMLRSWKSLHSLLNTLSRAAADVRSFGVLLFLFVFIYALVGMQLFANRLHFDPMTGVHIAIEDPRYATSTIPRHNYDTLSAAATTVFQVLSGENWNEVMYDCWKAAAWVSPLYFLSLVVFGIFIVLNMFLAILLKQFDDNDNEDESESHLPETETEEPRDHKSMGAILRSRVENWVSSMTCGHNFITEWCYWYQKARVRCKNLVEDVQCENILTVVIIVSSVTLAIDSPLADPSTPLAATLEIANYIFTVIFMYEFVIKVFAYGPVAYFLDEWNLLDFSALVASVLEVLNVGRGKSLRAMRTLRVLRPLKMIKRFPEIKLVVDALLSSLPSVLNVGTICGVLYLTFAIFGVTFLKGTFYECSEVELTSEQAELIEYPVSFGDFTDNQLAWLQPDAIECNLEVWSSEYVPSSKELCHCIGSAWEPIIAQNFDNVLRGFSLLFEISTTEGWVDVMYAAIDQRGIDMQPVRGSNEIWAAYFIVFLLLGAFFLLELFVGVIVENFARMKEIKGHGLMTASQREWALTQTFVMKIKPERRFARPAAKLRAACYDFVMPSLNPWFDRFIVGVILLNTACIAAAVKTGYLETINEVCSAIFIAEATLKITALGRAYFRSKWNRFDFTIVLGLIIGFILKLTINDAELASSISSVISLLRIGRLIRLIRLVKSLRLIVNSIVTAIPGILNIGGLLLLLYFVYAVIGMNLYGLIGFQGELNEHANFQSLGNSMLLLFRFSTGENWNGFMWDLLEERPHCDPNPTYNKTLPWCIREEDYPSCTEVNGCSAGGSVFVYFYSFVLIVGLVALNMFVGVVLEAFENSRESDILSPNDLDHFVSVWSEFDPKATNYIRASEITAFLRRLKPPLGISENESYDRDSIYFKDQSLLEIAVNEKKNVHIINVARQVAKRLVKAKQGDSFRDLSDDHPVQKRAMKQQEDMKMTLGDVYMNDARIILTAIRRFRHKLARRKGNQVYPESDF